MNPKDEKIQKLIMEARQIMSISPDPTHDISHVERVVKYTAAMITKKHSLNEKQKQAVLLAAWWHDAGRTITKKPSLVLMPFFDDLISAFMLWRATMYTGLFSSTVGLATRIILCKSFGAGDIFTRFLLAKKNRVLVDLVEDADKLDILNPERSQTLYRLIETSKIYHYSYKMMVWWFIHTNQLKLKTDEAKQFMCEVIAKFIAWFKKAEIYAWHAAQFGVQWVNKIIKKGEEVLLHFSSLATANT